MNFNPVKKVTMSCPSCHAGIKLTVPETAEEMHQLLIASESFACPVCKEKFGGARELLNSVEQYNLVITLLKRYNKIFNVEFE